MSHKRIPKRKAAIAVGGVVALGAAAILLPNANASQDGASDGVAAAPKTLRAGDASDLATRLSGMLGDAYAGAWYDGEDKRLVVNVVRGEGDLALKVRSAGAEVREVDLACLRLLGEQLCELERLVDERRGGRGVMTHVVEDRALGA